MSAAPWAGKIFGIGFYKTGTTTLFEALQVLGYRTINGDTPGSYPGADDGATLIRQIDAGDYRLPTFDLFDAFTDNPYFTIWRELLAQFPDAKYILTVRDEQRWIDSCVRFYANRRIRPMRVWMFGPHADPSRSAASRQAWIDAYRAHNAAVRAHFAGAPAGQFIELDLVRQPRWDELCAFLGRPVPGRALPHANPTRPDPPWRRPWRSLRRALGLELRAADIDDRD
ncbi:MAG: sulfotransferase family protein [Steroidobacteraceae bacterium]